MVLRLPGSLAPGSPGRVAIARGFSSVRSRLLVLVAVAAVPLFLMSASIAWQTYRMVARQPTERAVLLLSALAARDDAVLEQARQTVAALGLAAARAQGDCATVLRLALSTLGERYRGIALLGPDGRPRCTAGSPVQAPPTLAAAASGTAFQVGPVEPRSAGMPPTVTVASPLPTRGVLLASLRLDWLELPPLSADMVPGAAAWIAESGAGLVLVGPAQGTEARPADEPRPAIAAALLHGGVGARVGESRSGKLFAYAARPLRAGTVLVVGVPAAVDLGRAEAALGSWLASLALLLVAALVAVAVGGRVLMVEPVRRLSRAVRAWREGGRFDPGALGSAPAEIAELAQTFERASSALRTREGELRAAAARQDLLMQEIHHRVKNNLQIIASLLNLQASRIRQPEARAEFQAARDRIRALATLHRHLYAHDELRAINMRGFLTELCAQLLQAIGETASGGRIKLDIQATELEISSDQAVPVALIVTEAVSNAARYAFPGGRSGHIRVHLESVEQRDGSRRALLLIEDDGVGIPEDAGPTEAGMRDGIGLQLIRGFARQLGATLSVTRDGGTRYRVDIPLSRERPAADVEELAE